VNDDLEAIDGLCAKIIEQRDEARANSCTYCHGKGQVQPLKNMPFVPCPKCNGIPQP